MDNGLPDAWAMDHANEAIRPDDIWVKLSLTVCAAGPDGQPVGLNVSDCGKCMFCADKPRFGGKGTKRQKCVNKRVTGVGPVKAWTALRVVSKAHLDEIGARTRCNGSVVTLKADATREAKEIIDSLTTAEKKAAARLVQAAKKIKDISATDWEVDKRSRWGTKLEYCIHSYSKARGAILTSHQVKGLTAQHL